MNPELSLADCDLIGLLSTQQTIGFVIVGSDGQIHHATQSARELLYDRDDFDPVGKHITDVEGNDVGNELWTCVQEACNHKTALRYQQVRSGRLMTLAIWPLHRGEPQPQGVADSVIAMVTYAADTSEPNMLDQLEVTKVPDESNIESARTKLVSSSFATWGALDHLTHREREVLVWIGRGSSQREIADTLNVSPKTVETHRMRLGKKLEIRSGSELVRIACHSGIGPEHTNLKRQTGAKWLVKD